MELEKLEKNENIVFSFIALVLAIVLVSVIGAQISDKNNEEDIVSFIVLLIAFIGLSICRGQVKTSFDILPSIIIRFLPLTLTHNIWAATPIIIVALTWVLFNRPINRMEKKIYVSTIGKIIYAIELALIIVFVKQYLPPNIFIIIYSGLTIVRLYFYFREYLSIEERFINLG